MVHSKASSPSAEDDMLQLSVQYRNRSWWRRNMGAEQTIRWKTLFAKNCDLGWYDRVILKESDVVQCGQKNGHASRQLFCLDITVSLCGRAPKLLHCCWNLERIFYPPSIRVWYITNKKQRAVASGSTTKATSSQRPQLHHFEAFV